MTSDDAPPSVNLPAAIGGDAASTWPIPPGKEAVARRLVRLGEGGVGGYAAHPDDAQRLQRRPIAKTAADVPRGERLPAAEALAMLRALAEALATCESLGLFPGALTLRGVVIAPEIWLAAEPLVAALMGSEGAGAGAKHALAASVAPHPGWAPPELATGAAWDNAANRYALGVLGYRLIAGEAPFRARGAGLRHALAEQADRAPPPFAPEIARALPPGLQSLLLAMIDPLASARPRDAAAIVARCRAIAGEGAGDAPSARPRTEPRPRTASAPGRRGRSARPRAGVSRARVGWIAAPLVAGSVVALGLALRGPPAPSASPPAPPRAPARLTDTSSAACASCHPTHVAEWERSVMAHAAKSPMFGALESAIEEQVGRDARCPNGAGVLRVAGPDVCRGDAPGQAVTGAGGEHWCVSCHAPGENLRASLPPWGALGDARSRAPTRDLLSSAAMEGVSCASCHSTIGPVGPHARARGTYEGNATWTSPVTGALFGARPEDERGLFGIGNSGYRLDASLLFAGVGGTGSRTAAHARAPDETRAYLRSSEFCGACHDVRLFGTDGLARGRGEHFKRLRNAYSEWRAWSETERRAGRVAATCADCHMSLYPGTCAANDAGVGARDVGGGCPPGTRFTPSPPGAYPQRRASASSTLATGSTHYFTSVDLPLGPSFADAYVDDTALDASGLPVGLRARRDLLLAHALTLTLDGARRVGDTLEIPVTIENTGAGHRVPAGFSQERELWVELTVDDARGARLYEVGVIGSDAVDLNDKVFLRINTDDTRTDTRGRPLGVFGADVADGPDVPSWSPDPMRGGTRFRGLGLVNLQNGFLRCVRCAGEIDAAGRCQAGPGQGRTRADRYDDGDYNLDSGECRSNLRGGNEYLETYFPAGGLDAARGVVRAPDAILDTRSAPPGVPLVYTYVLPTRGRPGPFQVRARVRFRAFPPYLIRAFADYETRKAAEGLRPSGPQVRASMLRRIDVVDLAKATAEING